MECFPDKSINENLKINGLIKESFKVGSCGKNYNILKDDIVLFTTRGAFTFFADFKNYLKG